MRLRNRRILVTGAASGIGLAVATKFKAEGAGVAVLDVDRPALLAAGAALGAPCFVADVSNATEVKAAVGAAAGSLGGLDGVVNCAGVDLVKPFAQTSGAR